MEINKFRNVHKGGRCYILGNGPSLNDIDLSELEDKITFGTNRIYLADFTPTYYVSVNPLVLEQYWKDIAELDAVKFLPSQYELGENKQGFVVPLDTTLNFMAFSNPEGPIWEGHTVTYVCMQIAYYMGFDEVILLGVDHDFGEVETPNEKLTAVGPDENHFHPDYFTDGVEWHAPDLRMSEIAYSLAGANFKKHGGKIINSSAYTKLDAFECLPFNHVKHKFAPRVSAIVSAYKAADFIGGCLRDLHNQSEDCEIVVVCQKDSHEHQVSKAYKAERGYNIVIVTTSDIPTVYHAWNLGVKAASGRYLTNANTDDKHHPLAYEYMADILDGREDIDLVYHDSLITWDPNDTFDTFGKKYPPETWKQGRWEKEPGYFAWYDYDRGLLGRTCFIGPHPMWRANLHQKHGLFLGEYKSAGDYEFWLRISKEKNFLHVPYFFGLYLARSEGVELGNPLLSGQESQRAIVMHQEADGIEYIPHGQHVQVFIDGRWVIVDKYDLLETAKRLAGE